jgi:hypothetical protein
MSVFGFIGYALVSDSLFMEGEATYQPKTPDLYISDVTPGVSAGVTVTETYETIMFMRVDGAGEATFTVEIINTSKKNYVFERVVDGKEANIDGAYSGTEISYQLHDLALHDPIEPNGGTITFDITVNVPAGVVAEYYILQFKFIEKHDIPGEGYFPDDMPSEEVDLAQRLSDILNQKHKIDGIEDARDFLINETIQVYWSPGAAPYVGSMDKNFATQIATLFGDVMTDTSLSFILKNEDLNWDGFSEIALYSTTDPLDSTSEWPTNAVCVYITVFTPMIDSQKNIIGYSMVCESLRGYAPEVRYGANDLTPSFSTDHWRDDIGYMMWNDSTNSSDTFRVPEGALSNDGTQPFRSDFNSYNSYYRVSWYGTTPYGKMLWECLYDKIPWLG